MLSTFFSTCDLIQAAAYRELYHGQLWKNQSLLRKAETCFNVFLFIAGLFIFAPGLYTSVEAIKQVSRFAEVASIEIYD